MNFKHISAILPVPTGHWVGDGFPVRGLFGEFAFTPTLSPFLMLDYAGPTQFTPTTAKRGVGGHPHKGFETVTIVYSGEVEHRDSVGQHGTIGPGDVQWMTAGSGILHEEYHSRAFAHTGGRFEMVQLWVNLPAKDKLHPPRYQPILNSAIPVVPLDGGGQLRVIAGAFAQAQGPAQTFTPMQVWDVRLTADSRTRLTLAEGDTALIFIIEGMVTFHDGQTVSGPCILILDRTDCTIQVQAHAAAKLLVLSGQPLDEPIAAHGPFVMNTAAEIRTAIWEYQNGQMGRL